MLPLNRGDNMDRFEIYSSQVMLLLSNSFDNNYTEYWADAALGDQLR
jgi:hypothetical protein